MAMMAMTTSSSMRVNPDRVSRFMGTSLARRRGRQLPSPLWCMLDVRQPASFVSGDLEPVPLETCSSALHQIRQLRDLVALQRLSLNHATALLALPVQHQHVEAARLPPQAERIQCDPVPVEEQREA